MSKSDVDAVGARIEAARKQPKKTQYKPKVPDSAVDACEDGHDASNGKKKTSERRFDDTGLMALVCRHDVPLAFANIDTPGEQQKYAITLVQWLFDHLPPDATAMALYDIGCVVGRTTDMVWVFRTKVSAFRVIRN